ncbi:MAG: hypothetical protein EBU66_05595 [Bacteroidetes bacterium]|nr:hypothetical protein [Bacteroidota bacterium]
MLQSYEDPQCMFCKRGWASEFMAANFSVSFRGSTLRKHRRKILVEREKALLPSMQVFVEYKKEAAKYLAISDEFRTQLGDTMIHNEEVYTKTIAGRYKIFDTTFEALRQERMMSDHKIKKLRKEIQNHEAGSEEEKAIRDQIQTLKKNRTAQDEKVTILMDENKELIDTYKSLTKRKNEAIHEYIRYRNMYDGIEGDNKQKRIFIMKCADEECRGFLSTSYKCGTCEKWTCPDCLVVIGAEKDTTHICDPNTVESAKAIKAETRGCPKCATRIFKIDGCDQMWCVMEGCGTAFSWTTGQIVTGKVHNPHYYEWLRRTGGGSAPREAGDIPCGGLPTVYEILNSLRGGLDTSAILLETHRNINELIHYRLAQYPSRPDQLANKDIDVLYLTNKITAEEWEKQLEYAETKFNRKREIGEILQTLATASADILRSAIGMLHILDQDSLLDESSELYSMYMNDTLEHLEKLREFGNESLTQLSKREHMAVPQLGEKWKWVPLRALYKAA